MLETGIKGKDTVKVVSENTAAAVGSGTLLVFATPAMIALMEKTACNSVMPFLEEGCGTVGTMLNVKHMAATPVGMTVTCESELIETDGHQVDFDQAMKRQLQYKTEEGRAMLKLQEGDTHHGGCGQCGGDK